MNHIYCGLQLVDENTTPLLDALEKGVAILRENERSHVRTLVHCVVGASRSASVVIAYVPMSLSRWFSAVLV
jgi:protein-tyrosine phosphatase